MAVSNDFSISTLDLSADGLVIQQPTALDWGEDGRLYVVENGGGINVLTIAFGDKTPNDGDATLSFYVEDYHSFSLADDGGIQNHNDDGTETGSTARQVTGIDVVAQYDADGNRQYIDADGNLTTVDTGTPAVTMYVTSSDKRIGAGTDGGDDGLDTNSGVITRLVQTGENTWEQVDLIRGLARSEENHATNGLEVIQEVDDDGKLISERLLVANGGNANTGAPSNNFAGQQEQPLSAAILEVDVTGMLADMPVLYDEGRAYIYDLPTLDDPTRDGAVDNNDPNGGNDGLNSAKLDWGDYVSIYSPGYRNAYDVEVTEDGRVWTYDNGANNSWGGRPIGEESTSNGTVYPDTTQDPNYISTNLNNGDGNSSDPINLEDWNPSNNDQLHEITRSDDLDGRELSEGAFGAVATFTGPDGLTYVYGGHPNPTRAEGSRAGLLFSPEDGADNAYLLVSNLDTYGNGGESDYQEVINWFTEVEGDANNVSSGDLTSRVIAVTPGVLYDIYSLSDGTGVAIEAGDTPNENPPGNSTFLGQSGLPADIGEIVTYLGEAYYNPIEGDYLEGGRADGALDSGKGSINGLAEYTSTIMDEGDVKMSGALLATSYGSGTIIIMGREEDGTMSSVIDGNDAKAEDRTTLANSGNKPLGIATIGDDYADMGLTQAFQGSIWVARYGENFTASIGILQPANGAVPLAGSELVDPDDQDLDGVDKFNDPFEYSFDNGYDLSAGQKIVLDFDPNRTDLDGTIGNTGLMGAALDGPNSLAGPLADSPTTDNIQEAGATGNNDARTGTYLENAGDLEAPAQQIDGLFDLAGNIIPGGNAPILQIKEVVPGTMVGVANTARDALHTGIVPDEDVHRIVATITAKNWVADGAPGEGQLSGMIFGDGTQSNFLRVVFGEVDGAAGIEVGYEIDDANYTVLAAIPVTDLADAANSLIDLRLEIDIDGGYGVKVSYRLGDGAGIASETFTEIALNGGTGFSLPAGVLQNVLNGTHTISDGDSTMNSGAAIGIVAETSEGNPLQAVDFHAIQIEAFGNEIVAGTIAEAEAAGTDGDDTVIYDGAEAGTIDLDGAVENLDASGSTADVAVVANALDNKITVGAGANVIETGDGKDTVTGTLADLAGDTITDFSEDDEVVISDASTADLEVSYDAGSAKVIINGNPAITFDGEAFAEFDPADGDKIFNFEDTRDGVRITTQPALSPVVAINAGGPDANGLLVRDQLVDFKSDLASAPKVGFSTTGDYKAYSNAISTTSDFPGTDLDPVHAYERSSGSTENWGYSIPVEDGTYLVDLIYAEIYHGFVNGDNPDNKRQFDVFIELDQVEDNYDIIDKAGAAGVEVIETYEVTVADGVLNIEFNKEVDQAKLSGLVVWKVGGTYEPPADTTAPLIDEIIVENPAGVQDGDRSVTVVLSDDAGFDQSTLETLDGSELSFTDIVPTTVSAPVVTLGDGGNSATLVYTISPPTGNAWPSGFGEITIADGAYADAAGNTSSGTTEVFASTPDIGNLTGKGDVVLAINVGPTSNSTDETLAGTDKNTYGGAIANDPIIGIALQADDPAYYSPSSKTGSNIDGKVGNTGSNTALDGSALHTYRDSNSDPYTATYPVPNGIYVVELWFAELFYETGGNRQGDYYINGELAFENFDAFTASGAADTAVSVMTTVVVTDGQLQVDIFSDSGQAGYNAIVIYEAVASDLPPTVSVADVSVLEGDDAEIVFTRIGDQAEEITVTFTVSPDAPASSDDFTAPATLTATIPAGATSSAPVLVAITDDDEAEGLETLTVEITGLSNTSGDAVQGDGSAKISIAASDSPLQIPDGGTLLELDFETDGDPLVEGGFDGLLGGSGGFDPAGTPTITDGKLVLTTSNGDLSQTDQADSKNDFVKAVDLSDPGLTEIFITTRFDNPFSGDVENYLQLGVIVAVGDETVQQDAEQFQKLVFGGNGGTAVQLWTHQGGNSAPKLTAISDAAVAAGGSAFTTDDIASVELSLRLDKVTDTSGIFATFFDEAGNVLGGIRPEAEAGFLTVAPLETPTPVVAAIDDGSSVVGVTSSDYNAPPAFSASWDFLSVTSPQYIETDGVAISVTGPGDVVEAGDTGDQAIVFTFASDDAEFSGDVDVELSVNGAAATAETLTFASGVASFEVSVPMDSRWNDSESVQLELVSVSTPGFVVDQLADTGVATVLEDDPADSYDLDGAGGAAPVVVGDFSDDRLNPTGKDAPLVLQQGEAILHASQQGDNAEGGRDRDYITIEVPEGSVLTELWLDGYIGVEDPFDNQGFMAIQAGNAVTMDPATGQLDAGATEGPFAGIIYNEGQTGTDILPELAAGGSPDGGGTTFEGISGGALSAGVYTIWLNQGAASTVTLRAVVSQAPVEEPLDKGDLVFAVNAGNDPEFTDESGITYLAGNDPEAGLWSGNAAYAPAAADGKDYTGDGEVNQDDLVYSSEYYGGKPGQAPLTFTREGIPAGEYVLTIKLAEIYGGIVDAGDGGVGARIFDITVNGVTVLDDFDPYETVGLYSAYDLDVAVTIPDEGDGTGTLTVVGTSELTTENAKISALALFKAVVPDGTITIEDAPTVGETGDTGDTVLEFPLAITGPDATVSIAYSVDGVAQAPIEVAFTGGVGTLPVAVPNDAEFNPDDVSVVLTGVNTAGFSIGSQDSATGTVSEDEVPAIGTGPDEDLDGDGEVNATDPDIDGDGALNGDETFAYDATNSGTALTTGQVVRLEFDVEGTPFENGMTGALLTPNKSTPEIDLSNADVSEGSLNITATTGDHFSNGNTQQNAFVAAYTAPAGLSVETRFVIPDYDPAVDGDQAPENFQSSGVVIGTDQNNLVKFVYGRAGSEFELAQDNAKDAGGADGGAIGTTPEDATEVSLRLEVFLDPDNGDAPTAVGYYTFYDAQGAVIGEANTLALELVLVDNATGGTNLATLVSGGSPLGAGVIQTSTGSGSPSSFDVSYQYVEVTALGDAAVSIADAPSATEAGDNGVTTLSFEVTNAAGLSGDVDFDISVTGAGAEAPVSATVTFVAGVGTLSIDVANDDLANGSEAVTVTLDAATTPGFVIASGGETGNGTVEEDDFAPVAVADSESVYAGETLDFNPAVNDTDLDGDSTELIVTEVTNVVGGNVEVDGGLVSVDATGAAAGSTITFDYTVMDAGGNTSVGSASVSVVDTTQVNIGDAPSKIEGGDTGETVLAFPLTTSPAADASVEITYSIDGGAPIAATVTFAAGVATLIVPVPNDDVDTPEPTEVSLVSVETSGFSVGTASNANGRVIEDDTPSEDMDAIVVDEDIEVGTEQEPFELAEDVSDIDTSMSSASTNIVGNANDNVFTVGSGVDAIDLQKDGGSDIVKGTGEALDGTTITNAGEEDAVEIVDGDGNAMTNAEIVAVSEGSTLVTIDPDGNTSDDTDQFDVRFAESGLTPTLENGVLRVSPPPAAEPIRIEAEDFDSFTSYKAEGQNAASGGEAIKLNLGSNGTATVDLAAKNVTPGTYTLVIGHFDENDGEATLSVDVTSSDAPAFSDSFTLDDDADSGNAAQPTSFRVKTFADVEIGSDGQLVISGFTEGSEHARVDYIELIPTDPVGGGGDNSAPYAPLGISDGTTSEGESYSYDVGALFTDADEDELTFTAVSDAPDGELPDGLSFVDGVLIGTPSEPGEFEITVTASDGTDSASETFTLVVNETNEAPLLVSEIPDTTISQGDTLDLDLSQNFSDPDQDALTYVLSGDLPEGVSFDTTTGKLTGEPTETGGFLLTIAASDGTFTVEDKFYLNVAGSGSDRETLKIEAEDFARVPGDNGNQFFEENTSLGPVIRVLAGKSAVATYDLDTLEGAIGEYAVRIAYYDESDGESSATLTAIVDGVSTVLGTWIWDNDADSGNAAQPQNRKFVTFEGLDIVPGTTLQLEVQAEGDELGRVDFVELVPSGDGLNNPPVVADGIDDSGPVGMSELTINLDGAFSDPEEDPLTYEVVEGPSWLTIGQDGSSLVGTPDAPGTYEVTVAATDGPGNSGFVAETSFTITVIDDNQAPVVLRPIGAVEVDENGSLEAVVLFSDPEGDPLYYTLGENAPDWVNIDENTGALTGVPGAGDVGTVVFDVIASDGVLSTSDTVTLTVNDVNEAPLAETPLEAQQTVIGQEFAYELPVDAFTDGDPGDILTYTATLADGSDLPAWLEIDSATGELSGVPDETGIIPITIRATDLAGEFAEATFGLTIVSQSAPSDPVVIQGEDFDSLPGNGMRAENFANADGLQVARRGNVGAGEMSTSLADVEEGNYTIGVTFVDETDGVSTATVLVDGIEIGSWVFDGTAGEQTLGGNTGDFFQPGNFRHVTFDTQFAVTSSSVLTVKVIANGAEYARIDSVTLTPSEIVVPDNEAPTAVVLTGLPSQIDADVDTNAPVKLADIAITDDGQGFNILSVSGPDSDLVEVSDGALWLKAGADIGTLTDGTLDVSVDVDDPLVGATPDVSAVVSLAIGAPTPPPTVSVSLPDTTGEGQDGFATVTLSEAFDQPITVRLTMATGPVPGAVVDTLTNGGDIAFDENGAATVDVTIPAGTLSVAVPFSAFDDDDIEDPLESFTVSISDANTGSVIDGEADLVPIDAVDGVAEGAVADNDTAPTEPTVVMRINAYGPEVAATNGGPNWMGDEFNDPETQENENSPYLTTTQDRGDSFGYSGAGPIPTGVPAEVMQTARSSNAPFSYNIPTSDLAGNGEYIVRLHLAELWTGAGGDDDRVFDLKLEDTTYAGIDVADDGDGFSHEMREYTVLVDDGVLNIEFAQGAEDNPIVNAIEILKAPEDTTPDIDGPTAEVALTQPSSVDGVLAVAITLSDETGVDALTLGDADLALTIDGNPEIAAVTFIGFAGGVASYEIAAPTGGWEDGTQVSVQLLDGAVADTLANVNAAVSEAITLQIGGGTPGDVSPTGDLDGDGTVNASDTDVDGDGILNVDDSFAYDAANGMTLATGESRVYDFETDGTIYENGMTGFLQGRTATGAEPGGGASFDEDTGAASVSDGSLTVVQNTTGDTGTDNNPQDDVQVGVKNGAFTVVGLVQNPWFGSAPAVLNSYDQLGLHVGVDSSNMVKLVFGQAAGVVEFQMQIDSASTKLPANSNAPLPADAQLSDFATAEITLEVLSTSGTEAKVTGSVRFLDELGVEIAQQTYGTFTVTGDLAAALADAETGVGVGFTGVNAGGTADPFEAKLDKLTISEGAGGGGPVDPPADPSDALEILESLTDVDDDGTYGSGDVGSVELRIMEGVNSVTSSNYGSDSFIVENTGDKAVAAIFIDFRNALYRDSVIDVDNSAGDDASKVFSVNSGADDTGAFFAGGGTYYLPGETPLVGSGTEGDNPTGGYRGLLLRFDGSSGGFTSGDGTVGFSGDMDPNSVADTTKSKLISGAIDGWDVGGVSGAELIGSTFTVLFDDDTTATGYLGGNGTQGGSIGEAVEGQTLKTATVTVNGTGSNQAGTYGGEVPEIVVTGEAGDVVRVTLSRGLNPVTNNEDGIAELVADRLEDTYPEFEANNAADFQFYDITIGADGTATLPDSAFDWLNSDSGKDFSGTAYTNGFETAPAVVGVSVIDPTTEMPLGTTDRVYLTNDGGPVTGGGGSEPTTGTIYQMIDGGVVFEAEDADRSGTSGWVFETVEQASNEDPAPQGDGYIIWEGGNSFGNPANNSTLSYSFITDESGNFTVKGLFGRRVDPNSTEANDLFVRLVDADGNPVDPVPQIKGGLYHLHVKGGENVEVESLENIPSDDRIVLNNADKWMKFYLGGIGLNELKPGGQNGDNGGINVVYELDAGTVYTLQIAGRSEYFEVDRLAVAKTGANSLVQSGDASPIYNPDGDNPPAFSSATNLSVEEGQTFVVDVNATDPEGDSVVYAIAGGADADLFTINPTTGVLSFDNAPDFEAPADVGGDNNYQVQVSASDEGGLSSTQSLSVSVTNDPSDDQGGGGSDDLIYFSVLDDAKLEIDDLLEDGDSYAIADLGGSIEFTGTVTTPGVGSVGLKVLDSVGNVVQSVVENLAPWDITVSANSLAAGDYTLVADLYDLAQGSGPLLGTEAIDFSITVDSNGGGGGAGSGVLRSAVALGTDDTDQSANGGTVYLSKSDLELGDKGRDVGLRFTGLDLESLEGANITDAYIQFTARSGSSGAIDAVLHMEDSLSAATFSGSNGPTDRTYSDDFEFNWVDSTVPSTGDQFRTGDFSTEFEQFLTSFSGQASSSDELVFVFEDVSGVRKALSFEGGSPAELVIEYEFDIL